MNRENIYTDPEITGGEAQFAGWFDRDAATDYPEAGPDEPGQEPRSGEVLWRTAQGRWVLQRWSARWDTPDRFTFYDPKAAPLWLGRNGYSNEEIDEATGMVMPDELDLRGRPAIGSPVKVILPEETIARLDEAIAQGDASSRSEAARQLIQDAIGAPDNPSE